MSNYSVYRRIWGCLLKYIKQANLHHTKLSHFKIACCVLVLSFTLRWLPTADLVAQTGSWPQTVPKCNVVTLAQRQRGIKIPCCTMLIHYPAHRLWEDRGLRSWWNSERWIHLSCIDNYIQFLPFVCTLTKNNVLKQSFSCHEFVLVCSWSNVSAPLIAEQKRWAPSKEEKCTQRVFLRGLGCWRRFQIGTVIQLHWNEAQRSTVKSRISRAGKLKTPTLFIRPVFNSWPPTFAILFLSFSMLPLYAVVDQW